MNQPDDQAIHEMIAAFADVLLDQLQSLCRSSGTIITRDQAKCMLGNIGLQMVLELMTQP